MPRATFSHLSAFSGVSRPHALAGVIAAVGAEHVAAYTLLYTLSLHSRNRYYGCQIGNPTAARMFRRCALLVGILSCHLQPVGHSRTAVPTQYTREYIRVYSPYTVFFGAKVGCVPQSQISGKGSCQALRP